MGGDGQKRNQVVGELWRERSLGETTRIGGHFESGVETSAMGSPWDL